jgi:hypothetical protein
MNVTISMFPPFATGEYLASISGRYGDIKYAVSHTSPGYYSKGQCWSFWMEDDPRQIDGILFLAKYRCYESGKEDSKWELIE